MSAAVVLLPSFSYCLSWLSSQFDLNFSYLSVVTLLVSLVFDVEVTFFESVALSGSETETFAVLPVSRYASSAACFELIPDLRCG